MKWRLVLSDEEMEYIIEKLNTIKDKDNQDKSLNLTIKLRLANALHKIKIK